MLRTNVLGRGLSVLGTACTVTVLSGLLVSSCSPPPATEEDATGGAPAETQQAEKPQPLVAWIDEIVPEDGPAPLTVKFTSAVKGGTPPYAYRWVFDDETEEGTEAHPVHTYTQTGLYYPELYVRDAGGVEDEDMDVVEVK